MKFKDRSIVIDKLLEYIKESRLNDKQMEIILNIVENLDCATETQKERFILYYGLNKNGLEFKNLTKIAKIYGCTASAVRESVVSIRNKLARLKDNFELIEKIVSDCEKYNKE